MVSELLHVTAGSALGCALGLYARRAIRKFERPEKRKNHAWIVWALSLYAPCLLMYEIAQHGTTTNTYGQFILLLVVHSTLLILSTQDLLTMHLDTSLCACVTIFVLLLSWAIPGSLLRDARFTPSFIENASGLQQSVFVLAASVLIVIFLTTSGDVALTLAARRGPIKGITVYGALLKKDRRNKIVVPTLVCVVTLTAIALLGHGPHRAAFASVVTGVFGAMLVMWLLAFFVSILVKKQAMGSGDLAFIMMIGALCGALGGILTVLASGFVGATWSIVLGVAGKDWKKFPMIPSLAIAAWIVTGAWTPICNWLYFRFFAGW